MDSEESEEKGGARRGRGKTQKSNIPPFVPGPPDLDEDLRAVKEKCREGILSGDPERLLWALRNHEPVAIVVIVELVASNDPRWAEISPGLESEFSSFFKKQSEALKERAPAEWPDRERDALFVLEVARALLIIAPDYRVKSEFLDSVLGVWGAIRYEGRWEVLVVLRFFDPDEVMAKLIAIMQAVYSREDSEKGDFYEIIDALIRSWSGSDDRSVKVEDSFESAFSLYATFFSSLFSIEPRAKEPKKHVDEVKRLVFAKVEARANALGEELDLVVKGLKEARLAPSLVYVSVLRYSGSSQNRIRAAEYLGEHGEVSTVQPLPREVQEIQPALYSAGEEGNPTEVRQAAQKALDRYIERGKEAAKLASSPKSPIPTGLPTLPDIRDTPPVVRMEAPGAAAGPGSKAISPDLKPSSSQLGEEVDLKRSTLPVSRRPRETILTHLEGMQKRLTELHAPVVEELRSALQGLHELKSLGSYTDNARAAAMVYRLAKSCEMDLTYEGKRVALSCRDREDYKAGVFRLHTLSAKQELLYDRTPFPPLDLTSSHDAVIGEEVDLARSTLMPAGRRTGEAILAHLEGMQKRLTELHAPVVEELRSALQGLHELKSLGSYTDNARVAATVYRLAKSCGMELTYDGERVALSCRDRKDCKAGVFRLRASSEKQESRYERTVFPPLDLTSSHDLDQ